MGTGMAEHSESFCKEHRVTQPATVVACAPAQDTFQLIPRPLRHANASTISGINADFQPANFEVSVRETGEGFDGFSGKPLACVTGVNPVADFKLGHGPVPTD